MTEEGNELLLTYLNDTLPNLGLDAETYSAYVMGCFENINYDDNENDDETLEESLSEIIGLLQASSETHSDDESVWDELKSQVLKKHLDYMKVVNEKKNAELMEKKKVCVLFRNHGICLVYLQQSVLHLLTHPRIP